MIYHTSPVAAGAKYVDGKVDCRLAYSYNGWHFQRCLDTRFLPHAAPGEPGYGAIYPSSMVSLDDGTIRIYSSASESEHARLLSEPESGQGSLLLHELRRDGFDYLEPPGGPGSLTTRRLKLTVNAQAPHGVVRVQVPTAPIDRWRGTALTSACHSPGTTRLGNRAGARDERWRRFRVR